MPFFRLLGHKDHPHSVVGRLCRALQHLTDHPHAADWEKHKDEAAKDLATLMVLVHGKDDRRGPELTRQQSQRSHHQQQHSQELDSSPTAAAPQQQQHTHRPRQQQPNACSLSSLATAIVSSELLALLVEHLPDICFDARKDAVSVFRFACQYRPEGGAIGGLDYILSHPDIVTRLVAGYASPPKIALSYSAMFQALLRPGSSEMTQHILHSGALHVLFDALHMVTFEVAGDAMAAFKALMTQHTDAVAAFLDDEARYCEFAARFNDLVTRANCIVNKQALRLLADMLTHPAHARTMQRYVGDVQNLMLVMNQLKASTRQVPAEALRVFALFVLYPDKSASETQILVSNHDKLITYLDRVCQRLEGQLQGEAGWSQDTESLLQTGLQLKQAVNVMAQQCSRPSQQSSSPAAQRTVLAL